MAANKILEETTRLLNFANDGFKYNLQVFPDTITAAALFFSLLFQSAPLGALTSSIILMAYIHPIVATFLSSLMGGLVGPGNWQYCSGHFPGISYERLLEMSSDAKFGALNVAMWPSYYTFFLGFLSGYLGLLPLIYNKELSASPRRKAATTTGLVILALVVLMCAIYRNMSGCDDVAGTVVGILVGGMLGMVFVGFLAWISDRRVTNILSFPLIRDKIQDGKPIYVCERPTVK